MVNLLQEVWPKSGPRTLDEGFCWTKDGGRGAKETMLGGKSCAYILQLNI